jgi:D-beta-D-heptose 7-phosphate kinase/D-beta-D-heptose 1-phosphate adenosyltransferase
MLDKYVYGDASRISPEAPVPVVHVRRQVFIPGGVGNVVRNLAAWGIVPLAVSVIGDDGDGERVAAFLAPEGGGAPGLVRDPSRPTTVKTRIVAGIQQVVRVDEEVLRPLAGDVAGRLLRAVEAFLPEAGAVAVSDYGKGVVNADLIRRVIEMASARKIPVAVDPKGFEYAKYAGADLVKPNRKELGEAVGDNIDSDGKVVAAGRELMRRFGIRNVLVTLSDKGMLLLRGEDGGANPVPLPSRAREVFDVTGAGDTVLAGMAASMALGAPLELGARLATLAAGVVVGKVGTAVASPDEIGKAAREE